MTNVRPGISTDLNAWSRMRSRLWHSKSAEWHAQDLSNTIGQAHFQGWIAEEAGKAIGFAEASLRPFANGCQSRPVVFLEGIWVEASHRRSGVSQRLLTAVETWARSNGIFEIGSDAEIQNSLSHLCHGKWGFEEVERVVCFRKRLKFD